jgi:RNA polymerase sigma factor (sigma-70 family)
MMATYPEVSSRQAIAALFDVGTCAGMSDGELLEWFQTRRDASAERAFSVLVDRHGPMVLRTCRAILGDRTDAEDAFQVTFLVLARKAGSIRRRESVTGWLYGVAFRTASYARGSRARRRRHERAAAARTSERIEAETPDDLAALVHEEVARLPERLRAAVLLCEIDGLTSEEAARRLNCPVGTIKSRLSRARERLKQRLEGRELALGSVYSSSSGVPTRLIETTVGLVARPSNGTAKITITAALAAWETGVLRSLSMFNLKMAAASLLMIGFVTSGAALLAQDPAPAKKASEAIQPPPLRGKSTTSSTGSVLVPAGEELVSTLAMTRVHVAEQMRDIARRLYENGSLSLTELLAAERRVNEAKLDASSDPDDRIAVLRKMFADATTRQELTEQQHRRGAVSQAELHEAIYARLEVALKLAEATTGRQPSRKLAHPMEPMDTTRLHELLNAYGKQQATSASAAILNRKITLDLPEKSTLGDALKAIKAASVGWVDSGLAIYVDPEGLAKAEVKIDEPRLQGHYSGTVSEVLDHILKPFGLMYSLHEGVIKITSI